MSRHVLFGRTTASMNEAMLDEGLWPATGCLIDAACGIKGNILEFRRRYGQRPGDERQPALCVG